LSSVTPRRIGFEELIAILIAEHEVMKEKLAEIKQSVSRRDFSSAAETLRQLDRLFRQHIADEEAQVLRVLIGAYGVIGADEAIRVFRQHRPIYQLMEEVKKLATLSPEELASDETKLRMMLEEHTAAEEDRVFPKAISTYREDGGEVKV
jgi:hemerythrin-like domain-containing protein